MTVPTVYDVIADFGSASNSTPNVTTNIAVLDNYTSPIVQVDASIVDCSRGNFFSKTVATALTWIFTNAPTSCSYTFALQLTNGGTATQTFPASVVWNAASAPSLTASGTDILIFTTNNGGSTWRGVCAWRQV